MAAGNVSASQVGSYFVQQFYQVLQKKPELAHQFYSEASSIVRVDGDSTESGSTLMEIHTMILSLNFSGTEIKTINALDSWNGGLMVTVSGSVKVKDLTYKRKFLQSFFLAPQAKGFFVLNDIFHFIEEDVLYQDSPLLSENNYNSHQNASNSVQEPADYAVEEHARDYVNSVDVEDDPSEKFSYAEQQQFHEQQQYREQQHYNEQHHYNEQEHYDEQHHYNEQEHYNDQYQYNEQQQYQEPEAENVVVEIPPQETPSSIPSPSSVVQGHLSAPLEEAVVEHPVKKTWASILKTPKGPSAVSHPIQHKKSPPASEWNQIPEPSTEPTKLYSPESGVEASFDSPAIEDEVESKSVYVRNLSSDVSSADLEQEFGKFGQIKHDGVFIRNQQDVGVCYAFVEFEDTYSVNEAIKASPIYLGGRQVYIEGRRPSTSGGARGRGRGSRGVYSMETSRGRFAGRGTGRNNYDSADYYKPRGQ